MNCVRHNLFLSGPALVCLLALSAAGAETNIIAHFREQYEIVGRVLAVDRAQKTCTIDRGERHGLAVNGELAIVREERKLFIAKGKVVEAGDTECVASCSSYFIPPRKGDLAFIKAGATGRRLEQLRETLAALWTEDSQLLVQQHAPDRWKAVEKERLAAETDAPVPERVRALQQAILAAREGIAVAGKAQRKAQVDVLEQEWSRTWTESASAKVKRFRSEDWERVGGAAERAARAGEKEDYRLAGEEYRYALDLARRAIAKANEIHAIEQKTADDLMKRQAAIALWNKVDGARENIENSVRALASGRADAVHIKKALQRATEVRKAVSGATEQGTLSAKETADAAQLLDTAVGGMRAALAACKTGFDKVWTEENSDLVQRHEPGSATEIRAAVQLAAGAAHEVDRAFAYSRARESAIQAVGKAKHSGLLAEVTAVRKQVLDIWTTNRQDRVSRFLPDALPNITGVLERAAKALERDEPGKARGDYAYALRLVREAADRAEALEKISATTNAVADTSEAELSALTELVIAADITPEGYLEEVRSRSRQFELKLREMGSEGASLAERRKAFWRAMGKDALRRKHYGVVRGAMVAAWTLYATPHEELPVHWETAYDALLGINREAPGYRCRIDGPRNAYLDGLPTGAGRGPVKAGILPHRLWIEVKHGRFVRRIDLVLVPDGAGRLGKTGATAYRQRHPFYIASVETDVGALRCYREAALAALRRQSDLRRYFSGKMDAVTFRGRPQESPYWRADADTALGFCNWLSHLHGHDPAYIKAGGREWECTKTSTGFRLPSQREWEYASRYGFDWLTAKGRRSWAEMKSGRLQELRRAGVADTSFDLVWFNRRGREPRASTKAQASAYPLGMFDMCGNTAEMSAGEDRDGQPGLRLVLCGGQFKDSSPLGVMPWSNKDYSKLGLSESFVGFRIILPVVVHDLLHEQATDTVENRKGGES
jgi:hypothetical protein